MPRVEHRAAAQSSNATAGHIVRAKGARRREARGWGAFIAAFPAAGIWDE
jgi:hypothetical protein